MAQEDIVLVLNVDTVDQYARPRKPAPGQRALFHEEDHPRGQPGNAGQFAEKPGGQHGGTTEAAQPAKVSEMSPIGDTKTANTPTHDAESVVDPATDYKTNGTRSRAFKAWFGDWEHDPANASKVVDANGEPQETAPIAGTGSKVMKDGKPSAVYHGTSRGGFESFDKGFLGNATSAGSAENLLYGPGFYFTEDKSIADEYSSIGKPEYAVVPVEDTPEVRAKLIEAIETATTKMENTRKEIFGHLPPEEFATFRSDTDEMRKVVEDLKRGRSIERSVKFVANGDAMNKSSLEKMGVNTRGLLKVKSSREVKEVFLNIKKPFDIDNDVFDAADLPREVLQQYSQKRKDNAATARKNQIRYGEMADEQRRKNSAAKESLKASGIPVDILKDPDTYRIGVAREGSEVRKAWDGLSEDQQDAWTEYVGKVGQEKYFQNMSNHHREMFEEATSKDSGITYGNLEAIFRSKTAVNKALQDAGYDGLTHIGGSIMGGGHNHRVWIAFEPNQIKSVDNVGTFDPKDNRMKYTKPRPSTGGGPSLFHEEDHPRGQPENAGQFAPKGGGTAAKPAAAKPAAAAPTPSPAKPAAAKSLFDSFQQAFDAAGETKSSQPAPTPKPAPELPVWQPKLFDAEPTGQKTMFDAGIEKGYGKKKPAAVKQQSLLGPSLVEKIEAEIAKQAEASRPMPGQKAMFSRQRFRTVTYRPSVIRYREHDTSNDHGEKHWITIGGHPGGKGSKHSGGTPVQIDGSGKIVAGPDGLEGKPIAAVDQNKKPESPARHFDASEFTGDFRQDFKAWSKQSAVPRLQALGYDNIDAQMIAFKAMKSGNPDAAFEILNGYADKKGPPKPREQQPEQPQPEPEAPSPTPEPVAQAAPPAPESAQAPEPEPEIPAAPEWFNKLREALESGTAAKSFTPDDGTADSPAGDPADDIHFAEWTPDEDPADAPPPAVAKLPGAVDPLQHVQRLPDGRIVGATQMNVRDLAIDPTRFQYKFVGVGADGVTKELKDSKQFNPMLGGQLLVWQDPGDGKTYVINGHHRYDLAMRSLEANPDGNWNGNMSVYFIDAQSPEEARALGAVTNIAEGRGTAIDAAKFLRDSGAGLDDLQKHGVSVRGAIARDAVPLSKLSPRIWQKVAQEMTTPERGIAIAKHLGDSHDSQDELYSLIEKREQKTGKEIPESHVEEMARELAMTPKRQESGGLFGDFFERSLLPERASLKAAVRRAITGEQNAFQAVASKRRAGTLEADGANKLDTEGNRERAKDAARQLEDFEQQSNWAGNAIAAAVNQAAERLANEPRKAKAIERELIEHVRGLLAAGKKADQLGESGGSVPVDAASGSGESSGGERYARRGSVQRYAALTAALERATVSGTF